MLQSVQKCSWFHTVSYSEKKNRWLWTGSDSSSPLWVCQFITMACTSKPGYLVRFLLRWFTLEWEQSPWLPNTASSKIWWRRSWEQVGTSETGLYGSYTPVIMYWWAVYSAMTNPWIIGQMLHNGRLKQVFVSASARSPAASTLFLFTCAAWCARCHSLASLQRVSARVPLMQVFVSVLCSSLADSGFHPPRPQPPSGPSVASWCRFEPRDQRKPTLWRANYGRSFMSHQLRIVMVISELAAFQFFSMRRETSVALIPAAYMQFLR